MAWPSTSMLWIIGSSTPAGKLPRMRATASFTSCNAFWVGTSRRNSIAVTEEPSDNVEDICFTPEMPAAASSTIFVTWVSSSDGVEPDCATVTAMMGTSMFGNCSIGSLLKLVMPTTNKTKNSRIAGIGFLIDQAEKLKFISSPVLIERIF